MFGFVYEFVLLVCFLFMLIVGDGSRMFLRLRFPYRAPRALLHILQAATRLSSELIPGSPCGHRSISIR